LHHALHAGAGAAADGASVLRAGDAGVDRRVRGRAVAARVDGALLVVDRHVGVVVLLHGGAAAVADGELAVARGLLGDLRSRVGERKTTHAGVARLRRALRAHAWAVARGDAAHALAGGVADQGAAVAAPARGALRLERIRRHAAGAEVVGAGVVVD